MPKHFLFGLALFFVAISGCKKEATSIDCEKLKVEMAGDRVDGVRTIINQMINQLSSKQYTEENIKELISRLKNQCSLSADIFCFDCIKTLPSQTEIQINFSMQGNTFRKILDITYSANNQMTFGNMHD